MRPIAEHLSDSVHAGATLSGDHSGELEHDNFV
jgi:hypothetical protein